MKQMNKIAVVGAGFSGAVLARELAETGGSVLVIDRRDHLAGNCHTSRDKATGVMEHVYGPHIFNTDNAAVWAYVQRFCRMRPFINRVKASINQGVFSLPINLQTINQFFNKHLSPDEAKKFISSLGDSTIKKPANFEEQALKMLGSELYEAFFAGYTRKQWGCEPRELPASILKRLPIRFNYDDNYYNSKYQGIPEDGYTGIVANILDHPNIRIQLETPWSTEMKKQFDCVFYTGPIDAYFDYEHGRLGYRTVYWERLVAKGDYQGNAVINYPEGDVPHTRIHEHKHFTPWENHEDSLVLKEYSKETEPEDVPYYPKRLRADMKILDKYIDAARDESSVYFLGRLATYRYMDMDAVIAEALNFARRYRQWREGVTHIEPKFGNDPKS